ncbi:HEPN domain-containing protein [candidate division KSB1 bacterium]|nr:HEPN domain-containing protein [candidate division KSB1 bacterium]
MLEDARFNLQHKRYRCSISRSYYACHHAARACLDAVGQPLQKTRAGAHTACLKIFGLYFIKTRLLPVSLSKTLRALIKLREAADYELDIKNIEEAAKRSCQQAEFFFSEVEKYVQAKI